MNSVFSATNTQKILEFIVKHPEKQFLANEIQKEIKISKGGLNQSLRELAKVGFVNREQKGSVFLYSVNYRNSIVKQFKILKNIELLYPVITKISDMSKKIVLFGSSARGEDYTESDVDLFVLTNAPDVIKSLLKNLKFPKKIQAIIRTPVDCVEMEKKDKVFHEEINRGIVLWEKSE